MKFYLENDYLNVAVTDAGAQVCSVLRKCDGTEHIWQADPAVWGYHAPILFPYCGRLKDGKFETGGKVYESGTQHGFARTSLHRLVEQSDTKIVLELTESEETLAVFPWRFRLKSSFTLEKDTLHHTLTVENTDSVPFSFGIGYHPAFAIPFDGTHTYADYELRFSEMESPLCLGTAPKGLVNGQVYSLGSNLETIPVTAGMFDNDSHCMVNLRSKTLGLYEKGTGRGVVCDIGDFPYCLIWSKPGVPQFICIEPWNSLPSYEFGSTVWEEKPAAARIQPGQQWHTTLRTSFVR
jgi:aldose 1-epimerase